MATFEELQRVCKHHQGRADDFEGMETPIQNHTLRCWNCLVSLEPIPADVVAELKSVLVEAIRWLPHPARGTAGQALYECNPPKCPACRAEAILDLLPKP